MHFIFLDLAKWFIQNNINTFTVRDKYKIQYTVMILVQYQFFNTIVVLNYFSKPYRVTQYLHTQKDCEFLRY